jgi:hypothetical protein
MKIYLQDLEIEKKETGIEIYSESDLIILTSVYDGEVQMVCEISLSELQQAIKLLK